MTASIMINWNEKRIFCETCGQWIHGDALYINGHHDMAPDMIKDGISISDHTVWEKD